ncbi:rhomboid-like protein [Streptomyces sp. NPDC057697]|uniref:rhomboid-like protein n=1 Tax=Streptomyces sp. NPDC057697 TaxID=3346219 RepID=UPI0036C0AB5E
MHHRTDRAVRSEPVAAPLLDAIPRQGRPHGAAPPPPPSPSPVRGTRRWLRVLPTPTGTPFTFGYLLVLVATSLFMEYADPGTVAAVLRESSTDVAHLGETPLLVLVASALWVVGGLSSSYVLLFALVLTALERRIGGWRTAAVFVLGHVVATLATEIPVGLSVVAGHLPESSLHRLDYGISFGLMASVGALTGLLTPLPRVLALGGVGAMLARDLLELSDPLTNWGHPLALLLGVACWPLLRRAGAVGGAVARGIAPVRPAGSARSAPGGPDRGGRTPGEAPAGSAGPARDTRA